MAFAKPLNENEKRVIRILHHPVPARKQQPEQLSYRDIADALNTWFRGYTDGIRTGRGVYGFLKRRNN